MTKASLLFLLVCVIGGIQQTCGTGSYYWPSYEPDLLNYASPFSVLQPDCDKSKERLEGSSESSSSSSSESSSEEGSKESKEGEGSSSSEESKSSSEESGEKGGSKSTEGSKEEKEGSKEEKSSEESKEKKKEAPKKKKKENKAVFPPRAYPFPARQVQRIVYPAAAPYSYLPYRSSYVYQQPAATYPVKSSGVSYQYVVPSSAILSAYKPQVVSRLVSSPITKIVLSPAAVPAVSKTQVYSAPISWSTPLGFFKK